MRPLAVFLSVVSLLAALSAQQPAALSKEVQKYVGVQAPKVILTHVRIVDGTGRAALEDQNLVMEGGKISAIQPGADVAASKDIAVLALKGYTVMPGIVGMHNHLFYVARPNLDSQHHGEEPLLVPQMTFSAPRLYL
ncbi:MAG: amidohydrolase, partial [Acidobacteria bacterium]